MSSSESNQPTRPEALRKLAQLQIERLKNEEEEEQWISGEELYTEGSSDEDDAAVRNKRRKHRRGGPKKTKQVHHKTAADSGCTNPPELKLESLTLGPDTHPMTDGDEQIEISWRPKRGSIKLPNLNAEVLVSSGDEGMEADEREQLLASTKKKKRFLQRNVKLAAEGQGMLSITDEEKERLLYLLADLDNVTDLTNAFKIDPPLLADIDAKLQSFRSEQVDRSTSDDEVRQTNAGRMEMEQKRRLHIIDNTLSTLMTSDSKEVQPVSEEELHIMIQEFKEVPRPSTGIIKDLVRDAEAHMPYFQYKHHILSHKDL